MYSFTTSCGHTVPWHCDPSHIVPAPSRQGDPNHVENGGGVFRQLEKKYAGKQAASGKGLKRKRNGVENVDLSDVVDFSDLSNNTESNQSKIFEVQVSESAKPPHRSPSKYFSLDKVKIYGFKDVEGLYFIPNPFSGEEQRYWVSRCVGDFSLNNPTNVSNLQAIETGKSELFHKWTPDMMKGLRWASLGYHFQWTPRVYTEEHRGNFPSDLSTLVQDLASLVGHPDIRPEAAIINYYPHSKCMMGGHLDDAEEDMSKPIVSASFGNTVIFLIGGRTRDVAPTAIYVRSGDIVLMDGNARYCYHGVPRMIPGTVPPCLQTADEQPNNSHQDTNQTEENSNYTKWNAQIRDYMVDARVNMNVRQVRIVKTEPAVKTTTKPHESNTDLSS